MTAHNNSSHWEAHIARLATDFSYPPTPRLSVQDIGREQRRRSYSRRLVAATALLLLLLAAALTAPPVRAAVAEFLQIGAVRIFLPEPTEAPRSTPSATSMTATSITAERTAGVTTDRAGAATPVATAAATSAPVSHQMETEPPPTATPLNLAGRTSLEDVRSAVDFPVRLPARLNPPDQVYLQHSGGPVVILVWMEPQNPDRVQLVLYQLGEGAALSKSGMPTIAETTVDRRSAVWVEGVHVLEVEGQGHRNVRIVGENVLVWSEMIDGQEITYRLETGLAEEEAVQIAESLQLEREGWE